MDMQEESESNRPIKVLCYNTLVEKYSFTSTVKNDPAWRNFNWESRRQQLILKMVSENADVLCLQEVRHINKNIRPNFYDFCNPLSEMGFQGVFAKRNIGGDQGEEGLAIFFNKSYLSLVETDVLYFEDGTGRLALSVTLRSQVGNTFRVATVHLKFPQQLEHTEKEATTLSEWNIINQMDMPCVLTGDFNLCMDLPSHSRILQLFSERFKDSHKAVDCNKGTFSLNLQGSNSPGMIRQLMATKIDYIFGSNDVKIVTADVVGNAADLPSINQPSDHLPITATFVFPVTHKTLLQDIQKLQSIFIQVTQRNYYTNPKFKQFLDLFWMLPKSIKNVIYGLTYSKAVLLGLYEENVQFGRIAFTNNTYRMQTNLDEEGNSKPLKMEVVKHDVIPHDTIIQILKMIEQRMVAIPMLIKQIDTLTFEQFIQKFDSQLHAETCNLIYGETYKIAKEKGLNTYHNDYGRVSFRKMDGWDVDNSIRAKAMKKVQLP